MFLHETVDKNSSIHCTLNGCNMNDGKSMWKKKHVWYRKAWELNSDGQLSEIHIKKDITNVTSSLTRMSIAFFNRQTDVFFLRARYII